MLRSRSKPGPGAYGLAVLGCLIGGTAFAADDSAITEKIIARCQECHGPGGNSAFHTTPRLNGQQAIYLATRFQSFRDPTRQDPHATNSMWSVKLQVPDTATSSIARYFSEQPATPAKDGGATAAAGKKLYESAKPGTPSCQSCHGERGEGKGTVPRLAGQHAEYLITQMWVFNFMLRTSDTMHHNVQSMTDQQIKAVASYLASD